MLSAFKRLAGKSDGGTGVSQRPAHRSMPTTLQRKFAKGVQYNMKIIIKGDRNVGKSCLFQRLQGQKFVEEYIPTEEIRVASVQWNYKATDDVVKVEVWDVVDRGRRRRKLDGLKMENGSPAEQRAGIEEPALDAEFLDVYKGTNGVIVVMDVTKSWTFDYVQRELPKIPDHIPVIVLGNHCDMSHHRSVTSDHVTYFVDSLRERNAQVRYAESSMRNGFGLKLLHKFFNLPFLQLQRETLLKQLETNEEETRLTVQELDLFQESDDADYDKFLDNLVNRRRAIADSTSATVLVPNVTSSLSGGGGGCGGGGGGGSSSSSSSNCTSSSNNSVARQQQPPLPIVSLNNHSSGQVRRTVSMPGPIGAGTPIPAIKSLEFKTRQESSRYSKHLAENNSPSLGQILSSTVQVAPRSEIDIAAAGGESMPPRPPPSPPPPLDGAASEHKDLLGRSQSFMSKIFGNRREQDDNDRFGGHFCGPSASSPLPPPPSQPPLTSVEDFVPDDGMLDRSFLDDGQPSPQRTQNQTHDSDSDTETANPLVAGYEDDLSSAAADDDGDVVDDDDDDDDDDGDNDDNDEDKGKDNHHVDDKYTRSPLQSAPAGLLTENPLGKRKHKRESFATVIETSRERCRVGGKKRDSISSSERELEHPLDRRGDMHQTSSDAFDSWLGRDSKWRQSPEGGEDICSSTSTRKDRHELSDKSLDVSVTSSNVHLELLLDSTSIRRTSSAGSSPLMKDKKKHKEKSEDKEKRKKKKSKDKEKSDKADRRKKRSSNRARDDKKERDEFEEFLNGSLTTRGPSIDLAYEAI